ncbi:hypothetical protein METP3_02547 [Methanosarcinales archaeon]|nr:hypothetical protein METP3_02547 [Methanosarcinales archaeon]
MKCCMAEKYDHWCENEALVKYVDNGNYFCIFHAPIGRKGISSYEFNNKILLKINHALKEDLECNLEGTIFEWEISFVQLLKSKDLPKLNFKSAIFNSKTDFSGLNFNGVNFGSAEFKNGTNFKNCFFLKAAYFSKAIFEGLVNFSNTIFYFGARFSKALFKNQATFSFSNFKTIFLCSEAKFLGKTFFRNIRFDGDVHFRETIFNNLLSFKGTRFNCKVYFFDTQFKRRSFFLENNFFQLVDFGKAIFEGEGFFINSIFHNKVSFLKTQFLGEITFKETEFQNTANFNRANFAEKLFFSEVVFKEEAKFDKAAFKGYAVIAGETFKNIGSFKQIFIQDKMRFENSFLHKISFLDTDLRNIDFINCDFQKYKNRLVLYDEINLNSRNVKDDDYRKIEVLYRRLKQKYKDEHDEYSASNWHFSEKEMFRNGSWKRKFLPGLTNLYRISSGYGERPVRSAIVLIFLVLVISILVGISGVGSEHKDLIDFKGLNTFADISFKNIWSLILGIFQYATFTKEPILKPVNLLGETLKTIAQILIPVQVALFALAVRNRFRR